MWLVDGNQTAGEVQLGCFNRGPGGGGMVGIIVNHPHGVIIGTGDTKAPPRALKLRRPCGDLAPISAVGHRHGNRNQSITYVMAAVERHTDLA